jgi:beta-glucosidase
LLEGLRGKEGAVDINGNVTVDSLSKYVYNSRIVSLSSAKFVGGAPISDLETNNNQPHGILNDLGWEIYPEGLYHLIMKLKKQYNKPIIITENGIADKSDKYRAQFIVARLRQVRRAINDGANIWIR